MIVTTLRLPAWLRAAIERDAARLESTLGELVRELCAEAWAEDSPVEWQDRKRIARERLKSMMEGKS